MYTIFFIWFALAILVAIYAHNHRNRNGFAWLWIALCISPLFAFLLLLALKRLPEVRVPLRRRALQYGLRFLALSLFAFLFLLAVRWPDLAPIPFLIGIVALLCRPPPGLRSRLAVAIHGSQAAQFSEPENVHD